MPIPTALIARRGYIRLSKETTWGTAVPATVDLPTSQRDLTGDLAKISPDLALNSRWRDFVLLLGRRQAGGTLQFPAFGVSFGHPLMSIFGTDAVTTALPAPTGLALTPSASGGTLATGSYAYRVSAVTNAGETVPCTEVTCSVIGPSGSVALAWAEVPGALGYNVYGRTTAGELKMLPLGSTRTTPAGVVTFIDTGSITPAGAIPATNTAGTQHLFTPGNTLPSYTIEKNAGGIATSEQFAGCLGHQLDLRAQFDQKEGLLEATWNLIGLFPTTVSATAENKPTDKPAVAAKALVSYGGAAWAKLAEFTASIANHAEPIMTASASLDLQNLIATDFEIHGTARMVFDVYTAEYADWAANNLKALTFAFPFESGETFTLHLPVADIMTWKKNDKSRFVEVNFDWRAAYDSVTTFPVRAGLACAQTTGY